ncbi:MAG: hypothetical protein N2509_01280 [Treponemataceae bacterium]|uniref:hypothetical protein n=1 Tax=Treponema sp. J25 TaxID=2094121 RepID=UPI00104B61DF|nr:hypothetical protein [Treponema sp. J25]MCX7948724.1 hypothetical protein [Treponemataceae bacterium]TCW62038.1 hypothetical protein C5O22_03105 [Treponema sp. J25]
MSILRRRPLLIACILAVVGGLVFADMSASVYMTGQLWGTDGFKLNNQEQKDADMLTFQINNERAGAYFRLWSDLDESNAVDVKVRSAKIWFKPISQLKMEIGGVEYGLYTEQLNWWKVPTGASYAQFTSWDTRWSSAATNTGAGFQAEFKPIDDLTLAATFTPGFGTMIKEYDGNTDWGVLAKYNIQGIGSVGAAYRDNGKDQEKIARVGFDLNAVKGLYAFLTLIARFDNTAGAYASSTNPVELMGLSIDNYVAYSIDKISLKGRFPVTLRTKGEASDPSYMCYDVKAAYSLEGLTPYFRIQQEEKLTFNSDLKFAPQFNLGAEWGYDGASFNVSFQVNMPSESGAEMKWSIPFEVRVSF